MAPAKLLAAAFVARPNRFVVIARLRREGEVACHLADPGRLRELLRPGAELRLRPVPAERARKTRFTVALVRSPEPAFRWVSVDTSLPNRLAAELLRSGHVRGIPRGSSIRSEVVRGRSRFDFLVGPPAGDEVLVEVKSVTLVVRNVARFPDAPTARGVRHVLELADHALAGGRSMVLFIVQRDDAGSVRPNRSTDPAFADALVEARRAGVLLRAARFRLDGRGKAHHVGPLRVRDG